MITRRESFGFLAVVSGLVGLGAGLSAFLNWHSLPGGRVTGIDTTEGTVLLAAGLAAPLWATFMSIRTNGYTALANLGFATAALGATISASESDYVGVSVAAITLASVWTVVAVAALVVAWWLEGFGAPIFFRVLDDFHFTRFLMTSFVGLLWVLSLAGALWTVFYVFDESIHRDEGYGRAILLCVVSFVPVFIGLLLIRLYLELSVVLFRIYERLGGSNSDGLATSEN